jgi:predicted transport protein
MKNIKKINITLLPFFITIIDNGIDKGYWVDLQDAINDIMRFFFRNNTNLFEGHDLKKKVILDFQDAETTFDQNEIPEFIREVFYSLHEKIEVLDSRIKVNYTKTAITYSINRVFLYIVPQKKALLLTIPFDEESADYNVFSKILHKRAHDWPGYKLECKSDISVIMPVIKRALELTP